jgi:DNA-binding XRE family transcriptional regulator
LSKLSTTYSHNKTLVVPILALFEGTLTLPGFHESTPVVALELRIRIADRIRLERRRTGMNQRQFAEVCDIPLRTFKRFENGKCDSLDAFLSIVIMFERVTAIELLFPPKDALATEPRTPTAMLERLRNRLQR